MLTLKGLVSTTRIRLRDALEGYIHSEYLPQPRRDDDLFIVEFPKSGITWLTFLVANINVILSNDPREVTFFNISDFVPEPQTTKFLGPEKLSAPGFRCLRSHAPFTPRYRKVFYLVRDPRNVMVSYWAFLNGLGWWQGSLEQLVDHPSYGISAWNAHATGWMDRVHASARFTLVRYEDLVSNTAGELKRLYALLGWSLTEAQLATAIDRSSIANMRKSEAAANSSHPNYQGFEFVRQGGSGGARHELSDELRLKIEEKAGAVMKKLGYL